MSSINFHSIDGEASVSGRERARAGLLCREILCATLGIHETSEEETYKEIIPPESMMFNRVAWSFPQALRAAVLYHSEVFVLPNGEQIRLFETALNTVIAMGNEPMKLLARLHAQCELHCYVEGQHRAWLADILEEGLRIGLLHEWKNHAYTGWAGVVKLLRARDDGPVVTSFSVSGEFPNLNVLQEAGMKVSGVNDHEDFYELPYEEQWQHAMKALRTLNETRKLEINPETIDLMYGNGTNGFHLYALLAE